MLPNDSFDSQVNVSSRVPKIKMDEFVDRLSESDIGFPVFSLCDCNSFHNSGYLWGLYAVKKAKKEYEEVKAKEAVVVINFDQHADAGSSGSSITASDRWGAPLLSTLSTTEMGSLPGCYLSIFNGNNGRNHVIATERIGTKSLRPNEKQKDLVKYWQGADFPGFWKNCVEDLKNDTGEGSLSKGDTRSVVARSSTRIYVFITVDRDCLKESYTQWPNGPLDTETLLKLMSIVVEPLININIESVQVSLVGFDVTGLPEILAREKPDNIEKMWEKTEEQLSRLYDWADKLPGGETHKNILFYSGSVSCGASPFKIKDFGYKDFLNCVNKRLPKLLERVWRHLLCQSKREVYAEGWKNFCLHPVEELGGDQTSRWISSRRFGNLCKQVLCERRVYIYP